MKHYHGKTIMFASLSAAFIALLTVNSNGQSEVMREIQAVYGGSIRQIDVIEPGGTTNMARIFASTDFSAHSLFYADVDHSLDPAIMFATNNFRFRVVPDFNADANYGSLNSIAAHEDSGRIFAAANYSLLSCLTNQGSLVTNISLSSIPGSQFLAVAIHESTLVALASVGNSIKLYFGALDASGNFTQGAGSPVNVGLSGINYSSGIGLAVNPLNEHVYVIDCAGASGIRKSTDPCASLSGSTVFSTIALPAEASAWQGDKRLGFGPDGRMFVGGASSNYKVMAYSDNDGAAWTVVATGVGGAIGNSIHCSHETNLYGVLFGSAVSTNKGEAGSWTNIGYEAGPFSTHANDSAVFYDPILDRRSFYCSSDQGIACSTNGGRTIFEIDYGLEAVAIQDIDMTADKTLAWTASKSGLRRGAGDPMALQWTPDGTFPMGDGAPYYSIAIDKDDASGNTVYAGNGNIYKTTDGGTNWTRIWAYESNTNGFVNGYFSVLAANGETVLAGFYSPAGVGGLLLSSDGGTTWAHYVKNVNVNDAMFVPGADSILIAAAYNAASGAGGIYSGSPSGVVHEMSENVSIRSLALDSEGGVYACGQTTNNEIKIYYKLLSTSSWTAISTNGIPAQNQAGTARGPVMTVGKDSSTNDVPIIVVDRTLYYLVPGSSIWQTSAELRYPDGTEINVVYWDDLMVGTSIGLYGQGLNAAAAETSMALAGDFDGDAKADPALYIPGTGTWKIKLSSGNYVLVPLAGFLGGSGYAAVAGDFDGDAKADPAVYQASTGNWIIKLSTASYAAVPLPAFLGGPGFDGYTALAADFDGDMLADPAIYNAASGTWIIKLSTGNYAATPKPGFMGWAGWTAIAADFDGDGLADPSIYQASSASWIVMLSRSNYQIAIIDPGFLGGTGYGSIAGDFDGDRLADPAVADPATGNWKIRLSSGNYALVDLLHFLGE